MLLSIPQVGAQSRYSPPPLAVELFDRMLVPVMVIEPVRPQSVPPMLTRAPPPIPFTVLLWKVLRSTTIRSPAYAQR